MMDHALPAALLGWLVTGAAAGSGEGVSVAGSFVIFAAGALLGAVLLLLADRFLADRRRRHDG